ncbi:MAG: hypothetical protein LBM68_06990 [Bacteroidales bacterium]|jgi:hypothetical protein|nr:hypothetical protein [Bacteroidales bacterium]
MNKKTIIIIAVVLVIAAVAFFLLKDDGKTTLKTTSVSEKWDLTEGTWTLAQREAAYEAAASLVLNLNPGGPWEKWPITNGYEGAAQTAFYQLWNAKTNSGSVYAFPVDANYGAGFIPALKLNGVYAAVVEFAKNNYKR